MRTKDLSFHYAYIEEYNVYVDQSSRDAHGYIVLFIMSMFAYSMYLSQHIRFGYPPVA